MPAVHYHLPLYSIPQVFSTNASIALVQLVDHTTQEVDSFSSFVKEYSHPVFRYGILRAHVLKLILSLGGCD